MNFYLKPFQQEEISREFRITGSINTYPGGLKLLYELIGPLNNLATPPFSGEPKRRDRLWEETCFELFLNMRGSDTYWEFNLSPSGDWNAYRFNAYREGMQEEQAIIEFPFRVQGSPGALEVILEFDAEKIIPPDQTVDAAVSAVLKSLNGRTTYWALAHHGMAPDFHRKDGFLIKL
jgi:hypothetical protein